MEGSFYRNGETVEIHPSGLMAEFDSSFSAGVSLAISYTCRLGIFMDKNTRRVIRMKEVILNIFIAVILASFGIWLIGGITYNVFQKEQIHQRILALEKKAYDIEPLEAYDVSDFQLTNRRAIIAKSIRTYIKPITSDKSPQIVKEEFLQYFMSHGWNIKHAWENPKPYLQVQNDDYIVTLDLVSQETNTWRMIIAYNNFFERNNL